MTKITLVTGASRGLGRNTALSIARHGGDVILTYRSQADEAQAVVAEIRPHPVGVMHAPPGCRCVAAGPWLDPGPAQGW